MRTRFRRRNRLHACLPGDFNEIEEDATDTPPTNGPDNLYEPSVFHVLKLLHLLLLITRLFPPSVLPSFYYHFFLVFFNIRIQRRIILRNRLAIDITKSILFLSFHLFIIGHRYRSSLSKYRISLHRCIESLHRNRTWTKFTTRCIRKHEMLIIEVGETR